MLPAHRPPRSASTADLVVLGAGPAGLAAARRAARAGLSVTVLERSDQVGGLAASFDVAGIRVDFGSHRLHPGVPEPILADLKTLLGADLQKCHRNGRLLLGGRWVTYPFKPRELARTLRAADLARAAAQTFGSRHQGPDTDTTSASYADLMRQGFGSTLYDLVYEPYARKLWGISGDALDAEQARRKAGASTAWAALVSAARRSLIGETLPYWYPRRGFGQLCDALAEAATADGARIRLGVTVDRIEAAETGVTVRGKAASEWDSAQRTVQTGHVFSTLPLPVLAQITTPPPAYEAIEAGGSLAFRAVLLAYAVHTGGRWSPFDVHYIPNPATPVTRISEPANHRVSPDDPTDRTIVCFEIPCTLGDAVWSADEEELSTLLRETVRACHLPELRPEWILAKRLRQAYPIQHLGYRTHLDALQTWADALPRITTLGRAGLFAADNAHHALAMGYEAADALGPRGFDKPRWQAASERISQLAVEI